MKNAVVDASIAIRAVVDEGDMVVAQELMSSRTLSAPELIGYEVANSLWACIRAGRLVRSEADEAFETFRAMPISLAPVRPYLERARNLSLELDCTIYDCCYLVMARDIDAEFLTTDAKFVSKLRNAKMSVSRIKLLR
jgi:predicted nucleic acid-binding protein